MANRHHLFIAHILFRQIQPEESQYHQSFLPLHGHETAVYDFASLVLPSFIVNGQYDVQFFNFTPVILPSSGCHSQHFFHHWFIGTAIFSLYLSFYQYSCYKDPHYDLPDLVKMSVGEQRCKAYIRQSQIIVNTINCHQATILQLRTSLLSCTCFGSSKACIAFSRNHSSMLHSPTYSGNSGPEFPEFPESNWNFRNPVVIFFVCSFTIQKNSGQNNYIFYNRNP